MIGRLNIVSGLFLGKEELNRQQKLSDNAIKALIRSFGSKGLFPLDENYSVSFTGATLKFTGAVDVLGIDTSRSILYYNKEKTKDLTSFIGTKVYISLVAAADTKEEGIVSLASDGTLTGTSSKFTEVLRSNYTKKGTKIYLHKTGESFFIKSIQSDTIAEVIETVAAPIVDSDWSVIGTFSPHASVIESSQQIYAYFSYDIDVSTTLPNETSNFLVGSVTWSGNTPTFTWIQNRLSILSRANGTSAFDYVVDSNESLAGLRGNSQATNVLIKAGTYTYTSPDGIGIVLHPNTKLVWAEAGSLIRISSTPPAIANSFAFGYSNEPTFEPQFYNLNLENLSFLKGYKFLRNMVNCNYRHSYNQSGSIGYSYCNNLYNCKSVFVNAIGTGFSNCIYLTTCRALISTVGFSACLSVSRCDTNSPTGYDATTYASRMAQAGYTPADTGDGGFNIGPGAVPPPPSVNNNNILIGILPDANQDAMISVTCDFPVATAMNIEVFAKNSLGVQTTTTIELALGDNYKTLVVTALTDPQDKYQYSVLSASTTVSSDATYTYILNY